MLTTNRRQLLAAFGATTAAALPSLALPGFVTAAGAAPQGDNVLVLVELAGGNDGLNTVVPMTDPAYRALRPGIGIGRGALLSLDQDTGLHPSMRAMADLWEDGDLRVIEGVGYPDPNRSHFRSIEIWNSGSGANANADTGWLANSIGRLDRFSSHDAEGLVLGGSSGPLNGPGRFSAIRDIDQFMDQTEIPGRHAVRPVDSSPLHHVLATYDSAKVTGDRLRSKIAGKSGAGWDFPQTELGGQLLNAARLLDAGVEVPVIKVVQEGYDTHDAQPWTHAALLEDLSAAIGAFARHLKRMGMWERVTLVTYSEFGRRARENANDGTDHGTAAPVFAVGGAVAGGFGGQRPSLTELADDDLVFTTDYRRVYASLLSDIWGQADNAFSAQGFDGLKILA